MLAKMAHPYPFVCIIPYNRAMHFTNNTLTVVNDVELSADNTVVVVKDSNNISNNGSSSDRDSNSIGNNGSVSNRNSDSGSGSNIICNNNDNRISCPEIINDINSNNCNAIIVNNDNTTTIICDEIIKEEKCTNMNISKIKVYEKTLQSYTYYSLVHLGEKFGFIYSHYLLFLHEKDLRNYPVWCLDIIDCNFDGNTEFNNSSNSEISGDNNRSDNDKDTKNNNINNDTKGIRNDNSDNNDNNSKNENNVNENNKDNYNYSINNNHRINNNNDNSKNRNTSNNINIINQLSKGEIHSNLYIKYIPTIDNIEVGYGLYTEKKIMKNSMIGEYVGVILTSTYGSSDYSVNYPCNNGNHEINALEYGNITRFINHSTDSYNCIFKYILCEDIIHIIIVSFVYLLEVFILASFTLLFFMIVFSYMVIFIS